MNKNGFKWDGRLIQFIELLVDLGIVFVCLFTVIGIYDEIMGNTFRSLVINVQELLLANAIMFVTVFVFFRVYRTSVTKNTLINIIPRLFLALLMTNLVVVFLSFFFKEFQYSKTIYFYTFIVQFITLTIFKSVAYYFIRKVNVKSAMIIGPDHQVDELAKKFLLDTGNYISLKYIFSCNDDKNVSELLDYINSVDYVFLAQDLNENIKNKVISFCLDANKTFYLIPKIYELAIINSNISQIGDVLSYEVKGLEMSIEDRFIKRTFDIFVSFIGLVISLPIMIFVAILIKITDGGEVFFIQERLTANNKKFKLIKFRTMIPNAEKNTGPILARRNDTRVTKLGSFLRKTRIDELPQFLNILKGEMSLVGPRPEREFFVEQFIKENPNYKYRLNVKAGVTGLAQALGKYNTTFEDKLRFDLQYIRNYSFWQDIKILLYTIVAVFDSESSQGLQKESLEEVIIKSGFRVFTDNNVKVLVRK